MSAALGAAGAATHHAAAWALTFLLSSTVILGSALLLMPLLAERPRLRQATGRGAILLALAAPVLQGGFGDPVPVPMGGRVVGAAAGEAAVSRVVEVGRTEMGESVAGTADTVAAPSGGRSRERAARVGEPVAAGVDTVAGEAGGGRIGAPPAPEASRKSGVPREAAPPVGPEARPGMEAPAGSRVGSGLGLPLVRISAPAIAGRWASWLSILWLLAAGAGLVRLLLRHRRFLDAIGPRVPVREREVLDELAEVARGFRLGRLPRLTGAGGLASPGLLPGPEICVPSPRFFMLAPARRRAVLAHELAHLERRDRLWQGALTVLARVLFFQPLLGAVVRDLRVTSEMLADARAVGATGDPGALAAALGEVALWVRAGPPVSWSVVGVAEGDSDLVRRVRRVLSGPMREERGGAPAIAVALLAASLAGLLPVLPGFLPAPAAAGAGEPLAPRAGMESVTRADTVAGKPRAEGPPMREEAPSAPDHEQPPPGGEQPVGGEPTPRDSVRTGSEVPRGANPGGSEPVHRDTAAAPPPQLSYRDSAGIRIVESGAPQGGAPRVDRAPLLTLGGMGEAWPYAFQDIAGVVRLDDGTVVVADAASREVRFFGAGGGFVRAVGGQTEAAASRTQSGFSRTVALGGGHAGELRSIEQMHRCGGEGVHVWDRRRNVAVHWGADGALLGEIPLLDPEPSERWAGVPGAYRSACSPRGEFLVAGWGEVSGEEGGADVFVQPGPLWLLDGRRGRAADLGDFPVSERIRSAGGGTGPHPFGRQSVFVADGERIYFGTSERLEIRVLDRAGRLVEVFRGPEVDLRVPTDVFERYRDHYATAEETPTSGPTPAVRGILARMEQVGAVPDGLPAYTRLLVDPVGRLWAERFRFPWEGTPFWAVFDTGGAFLGHVEMPPGFTLHEVGADWIAGSEPDGSGGWRVRVYPLSSQAGPALEGEEG